MTAVIHDLDDNFHSKISEKYETVIKADGKYAPCQGCFGCWTKHPARCYMKDSLAESCRTVGKADPLIIITRNCYGSYSPAVKNILDRSIGLSTPMSTYRGKQMHHTLRYGKRSLLKVISYGDITEKELETFRKLTERNGINFGYTSVEFFHTDNIESILLREAAL
ncbi:MAG: NAD(P)H-dependent oxidoreductase [Ruminococcus sp.]|nr:NAD(P)H-dependent oxidoreductase [Ruminococcus sp.]